MNVYVDSSVLLRIVLAEPNPLAAWPTITAPFSSELIRIECLRTIDRARLRLGLDDEQIARHRATVIEALESFTLVALDGLVLSRASDPFPTLVGSLDAIHLASALLVRPRVADLVVATHDEQLATAARAMGFEVLGQSRRVSWRGRGGRRQEGQPIPVFCRRRGQGGGVGGQTMG